MEAVIDDFASLWFCAGPWSLRAIFGNRVEIGATLAKSSGNGEGPNVKNDYSPRWWKLESK